MDKKELTQEEILEEELFNNKRVEFYSQATNAWFNTKMEKDKTLLALSTAGIGVLITFFNNISMENNLSFCLYILSLLFFITAIASGILIFSENAYYCEYVINDENPKNENLLKILDKCLISFFSLGLLLSIILSLILISEKSNKKIKEHSIDSIKKIEKTINSLKTQYNNDLIKLEKMRKDLIDIENYKIKLNKEVNELSNKIRNLENIDKLKQQMTELENKINKKAIQ